MSVPVSAPSLPEGASQYSWYSEKDLSISIVDNIACLLGLLPSKAPYLVYISLVVGNLVSQITQMATVLFQGGAVYYKNVV
ncbi:hypothetical protein DSO57_1030843 [Entomophthora muscae]|uniref:Uncharacterized protein n=1 Tax=Entomophthora muscae TaxID=34485 RepID=A0ACC2S2X1_9FUNG|nr:hypothetical protein DSO57_1030843 [Entomophthora muscae]